MEGFSEDATWCSYDRVVLAGVAQLVEHHVANVNVVGSSPITRSTILQLYIEQPDFSFSFGDLPIRN